MIVLSSEVPVVRHLVRSWSDADWLARLRGASESRRAPEPDAKGLDGHGRLNILCPRCVCERASRSAEMVGGAA
jgi:hypothetical protein